MKPGRWERDVVEHLQSSTPGLLRPARTHHRCPEAASAPEWVTCPLHAEAEPRPSVKLLLSPPLWGVQIQLPDSPWASEHGLFQINRLNKSSRCTYSIVWGQYRGYRRSHWSVDSNETIVAPPVSGSLTGLPLFFCLWCISVDVTLLCITQGFQLAALSRVINKERRAPLLLLSWRAGYVMDADGGITVASTSAEGRWDDAMSHQAPLRLGNRTNINGRILPKEAFLITSWIRFTIWKLEKKIWRFQI